MPTNRHRRTRQTSKQYLSESMQHFFETGDYCLREKFPDATDRFIIFKLAIGPKDRLIKFYEQYRDDFLSRRKNVKSIWIETLYR